VVPSKINMSGSDQIVLAPGAIRAVCRLRHASLGGNGVQNWHGCRLLSARTKTPLSYGGNAAFTGVSVPRRHS
jgi:hypothetical protein